MSTAKPARLLTAQSRRAYSATERNVGVARRAVGRMLEHAGVSEVVSDDIRLIVTELATNAVRHSGSAEFAVEAFVVESVPDLVRPSVILVRVSDLGDIGREYDYINHPAGERTALCPRSPGAEADSERGLLLVDRIGSAWEVAFCSREKRARFRCEGWMNRVCSEHGFSVDHTTVTVLVYIERTASGDWVRRSGGWARRSEGSAAEPTQTARAARTVPAAPVVRRFARS
ncbi:ATP-binding protein [Embleya sp. NPDC050493]|uniref:ATP-binding protein n=1 Tax=Embleya sp. NPDC050493 TaxID=3363989 RepID=UPI0037AEE070